MIVHASRSLGHITGWGLHEQAKVAIRKNYSVAVLRSLIHLIPIGVALSEIILNWNVYYVGVSVYSQVIYQLVAKTHEIMIQASLATILFSYIRHDITTGKGVPFGALSSSLQVSQISYLWSMEFWGTIRSVDLPFCRKIMLLVLTVICFALASLSGPSSAVLLVPRSDFWPAGDTDIWINTTFDDLYPTRSVLSLRHCPRLY